MAKGFEDTTCYNYYALCSVNEVGSCPQNFISSGHLKRFHDYALYKQDFFPYSLNATSTHDTKRSEDLRARVNVLSELSEEWGDFLNTWMPTNKVRKTLLNDDLAPDAIDEMLIYQTLLGAWPLKPNLNLSDFKTRIKSYLTKALRERKQQTSWSNPNENYELASYNFVASLLMDSAFMDAFLFLHNKIAFYGMYNSLSQVVLKLCSPGVPDIYQGNESWSFDLVDPDNRKLINYDPMNTLNSDLPLARLLQSWQDGRVKFNVTKHLLSLRNQYKNIFLKGEYIPLHIKGKKSEHVIAFIKRYKKEWIAVITCRWFSQLISLDADWSAANFLDESCTLPSDCVSLLNNQQFTLLDDNLLVANLLKDLPFNILKNNY